MISDNDKIDNCFYLPHHCVLKPNSTTTKLRVVFDASAKDAHRVSLNDALLIGPKLHSYVFTILLKFRLRAFGFTADRKQMYRQILVNPAHTDFQRILWRFSVDQPVSEFHLCTVTFGLNCSSYVAIRTLHQLAKDEESSFLLAAQVTLSDIYVDDVVSGGNSLCET